MHKQPAVSKAMKGSIPLTRLQLSLYVEAESVRVLSAWPAGVIIGLRSRSGSAAWSLGMLSEVMVSECLIKFVISVVPPLGPLASHVLYLGV